VKTIAITIDENELKKVDELARQEGMNRSELVREAVQEYLARNEAEIEAEREQKIFRRYKRKLKRQTTALVREQAKL
jgi:metal-responsive CopG/Arc/MetJ family transcriptional regulator